MHNVGPSIKKNRKVAGFAMILSLALISFVFLLVITLVSQVRQDLAYSDARQNHILAKAHARMGMMIAIGEIQKHLGPDMRVSTTADIYDERMESGKKHYPVASNQEYGYGDLHDQRIGGYPTPTPNIDNFYREDELVNLYDSNDVKKLPLGQRQWTGVWKHRGGNAEKDKYGSPLPANRDGVAGLPKSWSVDGTYDHHPAIELAWLVSGNEGWSRKLAILEESGLVKEFIEVPDGIVSDDDGTRVLNDPQGETYGNQKNAWLDHKEVVEELNTTGAYYHPLAQLSDPIDLENNFEGSLQTTWLLRRALLSDQYDHSNQEHRKSWRTFLQAEPVKVPKTPLHMHNDQREDDKATDWEERRGSYAYWVGDEGVKTKVNIMQPFNPNNPNQDLLDSASRLKVAAEPNLEEGSYGFNFQVGSKKDDERRKDIISPQNIQELLDESSSTDVRSTSYFYHSLTADSFGVLADLRTGGLKRDLSLAFAKDDTSDLWKKDFNKNFIFRDRVHCLKNIPILNKHAQNAFGKNIMRNHWFDQAAGSARGPLVDDDDVLLAGPRWSVLAEFHNLYKKYDLSNSVLEIEPPDQFPRLVGDNMLIFDRRGIKGSQNLSIPDAKPFFNIFGGPIRSSRPEPTNHPILPILTKVGMSFAPAVGIGRTNLALAMGPSVSLWNPYNKPMQLKDLFLEIPFNSAKLKAAHFNLKEYDLYRKWWIRLYNNVNEFPSNPNFSKKRQRNLAKDPKTPWGLFSRQKERDLLATILEEDKEIFYTEPGLLEAFKYAQWFKNKSNDDFFERYKNTEYGFDFEYDGENYGLKYSTDRNGLPVLEHENIRDGTEITHIGDFKFFSYLESSYVDLSLKEIYLVLEPGEVGHFAVADMQIQQGTATVPVVHLKKGSMEDFFLLESNFSYNTPNLKSDYVITYTLDCTGIAGFTERTLEQITKIGDSYNYSQLSTHSRYKCMTLYHMEVDNPANFSPAGATKLFAYTPSRGNVEHISNDEYFASANLQLIEKFLVQNYEDGLDDDYRLPGTGWEWRIKMPSDKFNENIILNDFNIRANIHSSQHGKGALVHDFHGNHYSWDNFVSGGVTKGKFYYEGLEEYTRTDELGNTLKFDLSDKIILKSKEITTPPYLKEPKDLLTKEFPWVYNFDAGWSPTDFTAQTENDFNTPPASLDSYDVDTRARMIGLSLGDDIDLSALIFKENDNPYFTEMYVPKPVASSEGVGYFSNDRFIRSHDNKNEISNNWELSRKAILFEIPHLKPLSLLEYRHANLNNYLHGPSYALGNSYASTQVARHRPWGRIVDITKKIIKNDDDYPTAPNWTASVTYPKDMKKLQEQYHAVMTATYGDEFLRVKNEFVRVRWEGVDLDDISSQFAPWRSHSSGMHNHQNTTIDHSYYLNRALLDGFYLTGSNRWDDHAMQEFTQRGQKFRPYLWNAQTGTPFNPLKDEPDTLVFGNHRFMGYLRKTEEEGSTWQKSSYSKLTSEMPLSSFRDREFFYQTSSSNVLVDGAFNINSTSVDAWIAHLSSLRGQEIENVQVQDNEIPVVRFLSEPSESNPVNKLRKLSDLEIAKLAKSMVRQVKMRGPFLSFSDFVNRRLVPGPMDPAKAAGTRTVLLQKKISDWDDYPEDLDSVTGLRGAVQAAIAEAGLNDSPSSGPTFVSNGLIPQLPYKRWLRAANPSGNFVGRFLDSPFGFHAVSRDAHRVQFEFWDAKDGEVDDVKYEFGSGSRYTDGDVLQTVTTPDYGIALLFDSTAEFGTGSGEAPENRLAVEHVATGANMPGWVMQADLLSPLAPVSSARSDTFTVRVMGETNSDSSARAWIELVVQRTPDYVKADVDAPHHRPHEPFKDLNLNGYWDNSNQVTEQWIDLNRNGELVDSPDLPGVGEAGRGKDYRDGMFSDLKLNTDEQEEGLSKTSTLGINQRFGRKFKIIRFRWLREQDV
jgi:hypothetical protein